MPHEVDLKKNGSNVAVTRNGTEIYAVKNEKVGPGGAVTMENSSEKKL
jgi:hypothetical protein